jgi:c-di-GMP-binding flagellar brake protein YcgR
MIDRRFERVPIRVPLYISYKGRLFEKKISIECRDISGGGLSFETSRAIPLKSNSRIVVGGLGTLPPSATIEGRVVYANQDPATKRYIVGVEFQSFVGTTREELIEGIHRWPHDAEPH